MEPRQPAAPPRPEGLQARLGQVRVQDVSGFFPEASQARAERKVSKLAVCRPGQPSSSLTRGKLTAGGPEVWCRAGCVCVCVCVYVCTRTCTLVCAYG